MVSVCMASFNGEKYIGDQIVSILNQIDKDDELIISDDGSTDSTIAIIKGYKDSRIRLFNHDSSGRPTENFYNSIINAKGEYVLLSDQDDVWLEGKYISMIEALKVYDLVVSDSIVVDEYLTVKQKSFFKYHKSKKGIFNNILKNSYFGSCMGFKRQLIKKAQPFPKSFEVGHDVWFGLIGEMFFNVFFLKKQLILYRRHDDSVTVHGRGKSSRSLFIKIWGRVVMFLYVIKFYFRNSNERRQSVDYHSHV